MLHLWGACLSKSAHTFIYPVEGFDMKNVHHPRGKRLLATFVSMIATGAILISSPATALSPPNIVTDIEWSAGYTGVSDIMAAFNNARRNEEMQLGLTHNALGELTLPTQTVWNGMSDDAKALYLINAERTARAGMQPSVLGLPLAGIETKIDNLARDYAQLLHDNSWTGHHRPSNNSTIDGPFIRIENGLGSNCREFMAYAENLAYFGSSATIPLPVERSIYAWIYDDASSSWGHREAVLLQDTPLDNPSQTWGFKNNHGASAHEGFLGIHHISSTSYKPFGNSYTYGSVVVMKIFDPVSDASVGSCGYNVTLRTEDLPSTGGGNQAPTAVADSTNTDFETDVDIAVLENDSDPDDDTLTVTNHTNPSHGSVTLNSDVFTYSPDEGYSGTDSFTYTIDDGNDHTATATVTITVNPDPTLVVDAVDDSVTTDFNKAVEFNIISNDSNPAGGALRISRNTTPPSTAGTLSLSKTGTTVGKAKFTPKKNYSGETSFTYTLTDSKGKTDTAKVTITIKPDPNRAPIAVEDGVSTPYNSAVTINVLANDTDPDNDTITLVSNTKPTNGTVSKAGTSLKYTPKKNFSGIDNFQYTIRDIKSKTSIGNVKVTVRLANHAPTAGNTIISVPYYMSTPEDNRDIYISPLLNAQDINRDFMYIKSITQPSDAECNISGNQAYFGYGDYISCVLNENLQNDQQFSYTISDTYGLTTSASFLIKIKPQDYDSPIANDDIVVTNTSNPVVIQPIDNDFSSISLEKYSHPNGEWNSEKYEEYFSIFALKSHDTPIGGTISRRNEYAGDEQGVLIYTPRLGFTGTDSFTYTISDKTTGTEKTTSANITVKVVENLPPKQKQSFDFFGANRTMLIDLQGKYVSDPDGDTLTIESYTQPDQGGNIIIKEGKLFYTPAKGFIGFEKFNYTIKDSYGNSLTSGFTLYVSPQVSS